MKSTIYTVDGKEFPLQHHGVKGMKWGRRKARPEVTGNGRHSGQVDNSPEAVAARKEARQRRAKRAAKIGAAVVAAGLTAYGAKKLHDVVRDKNYKYRMEQGSKAIDTYIKKTTTWYGTGDKFDWRAARAQDDRDRKYFEQVYNAASRQADKDSFGTAARNVLTDYLDKHRR